MRALPLLLALVAFVTVTVVALRAVPPPPPIESPPVVPLPVPPVAPAPAPVPADSLDGAIRDRRWDLANRLIGDPAVADSPRLVALREQIRRGAQRDASGVIESRILVGALAAWGPSDSQRVALKPLIAEVPYTLPEKRLDNLLVLTPRKLDTETVAALVDEMRLLRIEGLEINAAGRPLSELARAQLRYLGGTAIDRLSPAVFATCRQLEILDLSSRKEGLGEVLTAVAGCTTLRVLRLPASQPLGPHLGVLPTLSGLEELTCSASGLTASGLAPFAATRLRVLRLENQLPAEAFAALGRLAGLRRLSCTVAIGPDLAPLAALADLDELTLAVAAVGDSPEWLRFVRAKTLRLSQAGIDDRYAAVIARMPLLDRVELSSTVITDSGLLHLAANPHLRAIDLGQNPLIAGRTLPALLRNQGLRDLRLASDSIPAAAMLACLDAGQLERFTWGGPPPDRELLAHLVAWPGMVRVTVSGKPDPEVKRLLDEANERRTQVPPDLPVVPAIGF